MKTLIKGLAFGAFMTLSTTAMAAECIAPANPGGGWDFTCRQIGKILYDIKAVDQPVQVTNMAGAGGGLAFATVVNERNDDPDLIIAASSATTTRLAQNAYGGNTADQVRFVGAIGADPGVIVVAKDSPFQSLKEMVEPNFHQRCTGRVRRNMPAQTLATVLTLQNHGGCVPANQLFYALFHRNITRIGRLCRRQDGIHIGSI